MNYQDFKENYKKDNPTLNTPNKDILFFYRKFKHDQEMMKKYVVIDFIEKPKINFN